jgi:hypothetical protein
MHRKHSLDFRVFTNVAHHGSIFIFLRHTQDLLRKLRSSADDSTAPLLRIVTPVLVTIGILAVTAMIFWVIYERVSVFFSVPRGIDNRPSVLVESRVDDTSCFAGDGRVVKRECRTRRRADS